MQIYKVAKIMEKVWLVLAIFAIGMTAYRIYVDGFDKSRMYLLVTVVIILWYLVRVRVRKRLEAQSIQDNENED